MLYKKIHRQYLREFRVGRKFWLNGDVKYRIDTKPFIGPVGCIAVYLLNLTRMFEGDDPSYNVYLELIYIADSCSGSGILQNKDKITWCDAI